MMTIESKPHADRTATLDHLVRDGNGRVLMYIGGDWCAAVRWRDAAMIDPGTGETVVHVAEGTVADTERAIAIARKAFDEGPWPELPRSSGRACSAELAGSSTRTPPTSRGSRRFRAASRCAKRVRRHRRRKLLPLLRGTRDQTARRNVRRTRRSRRRSSCANRLACAVNSSHGTFRC